MLHVLGFEFHHDAHWNSGKLASPTGEDCARGASRGTPRRRDYFDRRFENASGRADTGSLSSGSAALWGKPRARVGREARGYGRAGRDVALDRSFAKQQSREGGAAVSQRGFRG